MDQSGVLLWVKAEPFIVGALQVPPPSKFSLHYIRKIATYVRTRATEGAYPRLYWSTWRRIACGKLQLAKDLAWLYFEIFDNLSVRTPEERLEWSEILSNCTTEDEIEKQRNKNWNDYSHRAFVCDHLPDLLELLLAPEQLTASFHSSHSSLLSLEAVMALSFLIEGTVSGARKVYPLHELALWQPLHAASGFSKLSKAFSFFKLEAWLRACLTANPFGPSACLKTGRKLAWARQVEGMTKRAKIACNTHVAPRKHRIVVMSQVYKQTLAKSSDTLVGAHVRVHRCNKSFIYLLSPLRSVTIEKCRNSTFVLGPVETALHLHDCENLKVIAVCHRLSISSTTGCTFHVMTPSRPLILSGNQRVTFAPYHTYYPTLEDHMARAGLATVPNLWDNPMVVCRESSDTRVFQLLPPCEFYVFITPFEMEGDTVEIPGGLPSAYQKALAQREQRIQIWQKTVKEACLTKEQRKQFQGLVENKFYEWLINTGHRQQLDSLVPPTAASMQAAG
ncbi:TBCC domain-containing protein 1 isoform X1 [Acomys russatus]|uniref:TBCC domain-containing protein 1 isoform X1 n=1 Tax=Acomys russatus TaxID=60746 RepID=UPI0021E2CF49|nr:TBCC domain-containing protein 1 isoform X1 [Acomys russatus]XP_051006720.1 TBCC domain-containing protein 1 isoform X1 [Acomys russatus]XP_051006722.1 TBCC domain-containing protein 1 isoform X1 [Acomys russatus]